MSSDTRLGLEPSHRILLSAGLVGTFGLLHGSARGARFSALRYLAENAHRLPRTKGTWYFFHKRRNAVIIIDGINAGVIQAVKYATVASLFVGTEAAVDWAWGSVTWMSTASGAATAGLAANTWSRLPLRHTLRSTRNFALVGAVLGLAQDGVRYLENVVPQAPVQPEVQQDVQ